jgi:hypothetical protein
LADTNLGGTGAEELEVFQANTKPVEISTEKN